MAEDPSRVEGEARPEAQSFEGRLDSPATGASRDQLLLEVAALVLRSRPMPDLIKTLATRFLSIAACDFLKYSTYDPEQDCMITHYWKRNEEHGILDAFAVNQCVSGWVWTNQESILIPDMEREDRFPICISTLRKHGVRAYCVLPLTTSAGRFGARTGPQRA